MRIVIIGNGISGITAARHLRKSSDHDITVISSESKFFYSRTALMYIYMGHMTLKNTQPYEADFWEKNRIKLIQDHVSEVDFSSKALSFASDRPAMNYDKLVLALGSASNKFGWPGQDLNGVGGLYSLQDLETMDKYSNKLERAVIVGGGLIGIEMAEMFHSRNISVSFLVREKSYWDHVLPQEESEMVNNEILDHNIDLRLETELDKIEDNGQGAVGSITTKEGQKIHCGFVGLTAGVHPNVGFLKESQLEIEKGILVDKTLLTNIQDVYAIGDCAQQRHPNDGRRGIEAIWYTGRMMGELVAHNILNPVNPLDYNPGIWFNSAKFFNIEYQVYGNVPVDLPDHMQSLFWQDDSGKKSVRINFNQKDKSVLGFNLMGIRFRHQICERWIHHGTSVEEVLSHLELAAFDPELYKSYEESLRAKYQKLTGQRISQKSDRRLNRVLEFFKN
ncbi:MAG TPA: FAD-dependent oxidoreductase [Saprospiraceae bacterium]|nr:FAD-dependent oxidoreductase [Saprospiraceae bacterium]